MRQGGSAQVTSVHLPSSQSAPLVQPLTASHLSTRQCQPTTHPPNQPFTPPLQDVTPAPPGSASSRGLRRIPLASVSSTNPLLGQHWEAAGRQEVAELADFWRAGQQVPLMAEVRRRVLAGEVVLVAS